jgi:heptosyltransferase-2
MPARPTRLLVVCPSWVGDVVMAMPALRLLRSSLPGAFIGALLRPGLDEVLAGSDLVDHVHVDRARGVMGPKLVASRLRPMRYDAALLLTNSFSTALVTRLAFIPRRVGYDRDARGLLLTERLAPPREPGRSGRLVPTPAVEYYLAITRLLLGEAGIEARSPRLELGITPEQHAAGRAVLGRAGVGAGEGGEGGEPYAVLNPGGNNPAKRWPAERFARVGAWLMRERGLRVLVSGSPGEAELVAGIVGAIRAESGGGGAGAAVDLVASGITLGALKSVIAGARVMLTNDTGPRHIAAALGTPVVTLFGPTDPRWTTLPPTSAPAVELVANRELLARGLVADEHAEECRIERIGVEEVVAAVGGVVGARA